MTSAGAGGGGLRPRVTLTLAAGTAPWESDALAAVAAAPARLTLVKRCLDVNDLLAVASTGTVRVALVDHRLDGFDSDTVERLRRAGVRSVVMVPGAVSDLERQRLRRLGVSLQVDESCLGDLVATLEGAAEAPVTPPGMTELLTEGTVTTPGHEGPDRVASEAAPAGERGEGGGHVVAVWGPHGAPGRTTVAIGLAAEAGARGVSTLLVDADPYGGAVGQHLAVLDEASGLLAAVRMANAGQLDVARLTTAARQLDPGLRLLTGLPRPDRWQEVRPHTLGTVLEVAATLGPLTVVDAGFGIDLRAREGRPGGVSRDQLSMTVVEDADQLVLVASADPVGLTRLARSLLDLREVRPTGPDVVVVNRMRPGLGWAERDVVDMVARVAPGAGVRFLAEDRAAADRALVGGRTLREGGDGPLRRGMAEVASEVLAGAGLVPRAAERRRSRVGRRRRATPSAAGTARSR